MYAIIETGGKQYKVQEGDVINIEKLGLEAGSNVKFDKVLAISNDDTFTLGSPYVDNAAVDASVVLEGKEKKLSSTNTNLKKVFTRKKDIDSLLLKLKLKKLMLNYDNGRYFS